MTTKIRYRGRKPKHARDPLAIRPAEQRAALEPRIPIKLPRGVVTDLIQRWRNFRRGQGGNLERLWLPTVEKAIPYFERVARQFPIAGELDLEGTWAGWNALLNFALAVRASEFGVRVTPIISQAKYDSEAAERPSTDEFSDQAAIVTWAAMRGEVERRETVN